jgi:molybdate transport system ATP-binding protein
MLDIHLKKNYGNFIVETAFTSQGHGVTAFFGHSGSGKTSIINMIAGLVQPDQGHIVIDDRCVFDRAKGINLRPEKRRFGYVFQDGRLFPHLSIRSNLVYGMRRVKPGDRYILFDQVVDLLGIEPLLKRHPATLSGGEKQRVAIGRSLLTSPKLLLMDEPLASLDAARKTEVLPFIGRLSSELSIPILYVSHSMDEILNLADTLVFLSQGKTMAVGSLETVTSRPDFQQIAGPMESGVVLSTLVQGHDSERGITCMEFPGGVLKVPTLKAAVGRKVHIRINPRNVAVALKRPCQTSFQNILPATVTEITKARNGDDLVDVNLNMGSPTGSETGSPIVSTITRNALRGLDLKPGMQVFAMIKAVSICSGET